MEMNEQVWALLHWCRTNGVARLTFEALQVEFVPPAAPLAGMQAPPPIIEGAEKMSDSELKSAMEQAERERLLFHSS